jgi:hypothetical protein
VASTSTDGNWRFTSISSVSLGAGDYVVGATYTNNGALTERERKLVTLSNNIAGITFVENRRGIDCPNYPQCNTSLFFPTSTSNADGNAYFGPNVFSGELSSEVTEPNTLLFFATRGAGWRHLETASAEVTDLPCSHQCGPSSGIRRRLICGRTSLAHSITRSAWSNSDDGILTPRTLAVRWLMTSSNRVGLSTGKSAGFAPLTILSTKYARWRTA